MSSVRQSLVNSLVNTANDNFGKKRSFAESMNEIANDIADAIEAGATGKFLGILMVDEIEALTDLHVGDYVDVADSGVLNEGTLPVERGDCVVWDGEKWMKRLNDGKGLVVDGGEVTFG